MPYCKRAVRILILGAVILLSMSSRASAAVNTDAQGVAIKGYDTVAYLEEEKAVSGTPDYTVEWQGATWQFSSEENRTLFESNPEEYAPQYGGYCAYAMSKGQKAPIDPHAWSVVGGKLYLNFSGQVRSIWKQNAAESIRQADKHWNV